MADYTGYGDAPNDDLSLKQAWANILRGLGNKQSWQELGQGMQNTAQLIPNVAESVTRGNVAGTVGAFGDLRDLKNSINSYLPQGVQNWQAAAETLANPMARALVQRSPNAEDVYNAVPRVTDEYEGYKQHEKLGEFIGPAAGSLAYDVAKLGKNAPVGASIKLVDEAPAPKAETFMPEKNELGFYSTLEDTVGNLKQEKGTGQQFLAQITKAPAVKPEEVALRGLDEFLANNPKVTRKEIMDYLANNKVKLEETVLDEGHTARGTYEDYQLGREEAIDDPDYIGSMGDDLAYDYKNDPNMVEQIREDLLAKYPEKYADVENNDVLAEQLLKDVDSELEAMAHDTATSSYWDSPIYRMEDEFGYEVTGNSDMGYSIKDPRGRWINESFNDISDAEAFLRDRHLENGDLRYDSEGPKYADYQLDGPKENYREVLIQYPSSGQAGTRETFNLYDADGKLVSQGMWPPSERAQATLAANPSYRLERGSIETPKQGDYHSSHFDEPNILAHMRVNDRVIDGKKTLFVEEIQSDWHQAGRKKGYFGEADKEVQKELEALKKEWQDKPQETIPASVRARLNELRDFSINKTGVPDAPYKKNWQELAMKRAIQMAVDGGYDRVAFTTGKQQADRYNLAKHINDLNIARNKDNFVITATNKQGLVAINRSIPDLRNLDDYVGKDMANKIKEDFANKSGNEHNYSGLDLEVGGEGMKGFYDKILPDFVNKYGKKYNMKVGKTNIQKPVDIDNFEAFVDWAEKERGKGYFGRNKLKEFWEQYKNDKSNLFVEGFRNSANKNTDEVHYFDLTPEAKSSFIEKGSPLFAAPALSLTGEESRREILEKLMK